MKTENTFDNFDKDARIWIYQANREMTSGEATRIESELEKFCKQWKAHGVQLAAMGAVLYNRFIVLAVDESAEAASGCSIDTSVHIVRQMGDLYKIDFFDRLQVIYVNDGKQLRDFHSSDTMELIAEGKVHEDTPVFNNMVLTVNELREDWRKPLKDTWLRRYL